MAAGHGIEPAFTQPDLSPLYGYRERISLALCHLQARENRQGRSDTAATKTSNDLEVGSSKVRSYSLAHVHVCTRARTHGHTHTSLLTHFCVHV